MYALTQTHGKPQKQRNQRAKFSDHPFRLQFCPLESGLHVRGLLQHTTGDSGFRTKSLFYLGKEKRGINYGCRRIIFGKFSRKKKTKAGHFQKIFRIVTDAVRTFRAFAYNWQSTNRARFDEPKDCREIVLCDLDRKSSADSPLR